MTKILDEVLAANAKYAENFGDRGNLPLPPSRHFAILTGTGEWFVIHHTTAECYCSPTTTCAGY